MTRPSLPQPQAKRPLPQRPAEPDVRHSLPVMIAGPTDFGQR